MLIKTYLLYEIGLETCSTFQVRIFKDLNTVYIIFCGMNQSYNIQNVTSFNSIRTFSPFHEVYSLMEFKVEIKIVGIT